MAKFKTRFTKRQRKDTIRALSLVSQIGILVITCVAIGVFLGHFLDGKLGTSPWLLLTFSFLGMGAAFKALYDLSRKF